MTRVVKPTIRKYTPILSAEIILETTVLMVSSVVAINQMLPEIRYQ